MGASRRRLTDQPVTDSLLGSVLGLDGPFLDRFREEDHELSRVASRKLEGADAMIAFPEAEDDRLDFGMPGRLQGPPTRIRKPPTSGGWQIDQVAHGRSVRAQGAQVNELQGGRMTTARWSNARILLATFVAGGIVAAEVLALAAAGRARMIGFAAVPVLAFTVVVLLVPEIRQLIFP